MLLSLFVIPGLSGAIPLTSEPFDHSSVVGVFCCWSNCRYLVIVGYLLFLMMLYFDSTWGCFCWPVIDSICTSPRWWCRGWGLGSIQRWSNFSCSMNTKAGNWTPLSIVMNSQLTFGLLCSNLKRPWRRHASTLFSFYYNNSFLSAVSKHRVIQN